jgi:enamine deaminase RidA (YjgF/YER057c/UK114 family)
MELPLQMLYPDPQGQEWQQRERPMIRRELNPTDWLLGFNINQGVEVTNGQRVLYLAGQTSNGPDGAPLHAGDLVEQFRHAWSNLKDALAAAGMDATNVVRLNMYTTDVPTFMALAHDIVPIFAADGCRPVGTLLGVTALFQPELMIELEATAVA